MTAPQRLPEKTASWHRTAVIAAGTLLVIALSVGIYTSYSSAGRMRAVTHSHQILAQIQRTVALLRNTESEQRGFLITGSAGYEDAAERYADELARELEALVGMVADNPRQVARAEALRHAIFNRLTEMRNTAQATRRSRPADLRQLLGAEPEVRSMGEIHRIQAEMTAEETLLLDQRTGGMQSELRVATFTILSSGLLALILGLQAFVLLRRALVGAQREAELLRQKENAETADREKSEFLANMSHEIRTPMNAVLGFAELLSGIVTTPRQRHYVDAINSSGRAMLSLINDILDLSKIEAGKLELRHQPLALRRVLEEIAQVFSQQAEARGVQLLCQVDAALPATVLFDQTRLRQILFNVVGNALKFTEAGSVTLSASGRRHPYDPGRLTLLFAVADTGIGIAPEDQTAIFEPFRQVDQGTNRGHGGTGLGLSITKRLTELLHGRVTLESTVGAGSTFRFEFPDVRIATPPSAPPQADVEAETGNFDQLQSGVILIADDVALNRDLIVGFLNGSHHRILQAANGREAVDQARRHHPDLILLDLRMPELDGHEVLRLLRAEPALKNVPVISVTASSLANDEPDLLQAFDGCLRKPFTQAQLFREMARFLPRTKGAAPTNPPVEQDNDPHPNAAEPDAGGPELIATLRQLEADRWPRLMKSMGARETAAFARELIAAGEAAGSRTVVQYGRKLAGQVERFEVFAIETTLRDFPRLVLGLTPPPPSPAP